LLVAAVLVIAVVAGGRWTDYQFQQHESHMLATRTSDAQATAEAARAAVLSTRQYTMPLLVSSSSATVRAGLAKLVEDDAAHQATLLEQARTELDDTTILPWHHALWDKKKAAVSAVDVQITALDAAAHGADLVVLNALLTTTPP
jgi:hypothetical protein